MGVLFVDGQRVTTLPQGWHELVAVGTESWSWRLLDRDRRAIGALGQVEYRDGKPVPGASGVAGGSLDFSVHEPVRGSGRVTWVGRRDAQPDWVNIEIQPWFSLAVPDGRVISWPMGVFAPSTPMVRHDDTDWVTIEVDMYDRTTHMDRQQLIRPYSASYGALLVGRTRDLVEAVYRRPWHQVAVIESGSTPSRHAMAFDTGTSHLEAANALMEHAGYFALYADQEGWIRSRPYVEPKHRPVVWTFTDDERDASYDPVFTDEYDWWDVPNRVTAVSRATGDTPALHMTVSNTDPKDPLSYRNPLIPPSEHRGRPFWVDRVAEVEAANHDVVHQHARRVLSQARGVARTVKLKHLPLPLEVNDRADFRRDAHDVAVPGVLQTLHIDCGPKPTLWDSTVMEVDA